MGPRGGGQGLAFRLRTNSKHPLPLLLLPLLLLLQGVNPSVSVASLAWMSQQVRLGNGM
jgi:hypothetical protein